MCDKIGKYATLTEPYKGYRNVRIIEETDRGYLVEICGSGKEMEVAIC